jgi:hypothetical protein
MVTLLDYQPAMFVVERFIADNCRTKSGRLRAFDGLAPLPTAVRRSEPYFFSPCLRIKPRN